MVNTTRVFCECRDWTSTGYYGLFKAGKSKEGNYVFVHYCGKPSKPTWEGWVRTCPNCWGAFSSPWSSLCKPCHGEEGTGRYKGWAWARKQCVIHREIA